MALNAPPSQDVQVLRKSNWQRFMCPVLINLLRKCAVNLFGLNIDNIIFII